MKGYSLLFLLVIVLNSQIPCIVNIENNARNNIGDSINRDVTMSTTYMPPVIALVRNFFTMIKFYCLQIQK